MASSIGELFVTLGFDVDDQKLNEFSDKIDSAKNGLYKMAGAATAAVAAIGELISGPVERGAMFKQFADQTGYSAEGLQKWATVASTVNNTLTLDGALGKYKAFAEYIKQGNLGGGNVLGQFGVEFSPNKSPEQYLSDLSQKIPGLLSGVNGQFYRQLLTKALDASGLGADYIDALLTTEKQREQMTHGKIQSGDQIKRNNDIATQYTLIAQDYRAFAQQFTNQYGPAILDFLKQFQAELPQLIQSVNGFVNALGGLKRIAEVILALSFAKWAVGIVSAITSIVSAVRLGAGALAVLSGPVGWGIAGATAVGVGGYEAYEHKSEIGKWWNGLFADEKLRPLQKGQERLWDMTSKPSGNVTVNQSVGIQITGNAPNEIGLEVAKHLETHARRANMKANNQTDLGPDR